MPDKTSQIGALEHETNLQPYLPPQLYPLGDLRDMTMGGSLGTGDSGAPRVQRF